MLTSQGKLHTVFTTMHLDEKKLINQMQKGYIISANEKYPQVSPLHKS